MSVSQQKENNQDGIDISSMLNDVNKVLHQHLTNILTPMLQEKKSIQQVLLNMPMVKELQDQHLKSQQAVFAIQAEAQAMKLFYEGELRSRNEELKRTKQELLVALKQLEEYKNVKLEVKDIPAKPGTPPVHIKNDVERKNEKIQEDTSTIKLATTENLNSFSILGNDTDEEEDDTEDEDVEEDDDEEEEDEEEDEDEDDDDDEEEEEEDEDEDDDEEEDDEESTSAEAARDAEKNKEKDTSEEDEDEDEEGDFEVEDVEIDGEKYLATDTQNGTIYKLDSDGEILEDKNGEFVKAGYYKNGISFIL